MIFVVLRVGRTRCVPTINLLHSKNKILSFHFCTHIVYTLCAHCIYVVYTMWLFYQFKNLVGNAASRIALRQTKGVGRERGKARIVGDERQRRID